MSDTKSVALNRHFGNLKSRDRVYALLRAEILALTGRDMGRDAITRTYELRPIYLAFMDHFYPGLECNANIARAMKNAPDFYAEWLMNTLIARGCGS